MTENETKLIMEEIKDLDDTMYAYSESYMDALDVAIKALEEIQEYRKIGTVEECREAVGKSKAKKPVPDENAYTIDGITVYDTWYCPNCGHQFERYYDEYKCCPECGQKIDWTNETEK